MKYTALLMFLVSYSAHAMQSHNSFFAISGRTSPVPTTEPKGMRSGCLELEPVNFSEVVPCMPVKKAKIRRVILSASQDEFKKERSLATTKSCLLRVQSFDMPSHTGIALLIERCVSCDPEESESIGN